MIAHRLTLAPHTLCLAWVSRKARPPPPPISFWVGERMPCCRLLRVVLVLVVVTVALRKDIWFLIASTQLLVGICWVAWVVEFGVRPTM